MLQIFSAEWCGACKSVKQFLKSQNIPFQERNIDTDKSASDVLTKLQIRSIPVIYVDDNNYVVGFDKNKILDLSKL